VCVLLLQDLLQSCARGGRRRVEDMCYERRRAEACVDESAHQQSYSRSLFVRFFGRAPKRFVKQYKSLYWCESRVFTSLRPLVYPTQRCAPRSLPPQPAQVGDQPCCAGAYSGWYVCTCVLSQRPRVLNCLLSNALALSRAGQVVQGRL